MEVLPNFGSASTEVRTCDVLGPVLRVLDEDPPHIIHPLAPMADKGTLVSLIQPRVEPTPSASLKLHQTPV